MFDFYMHICCNRQPLTTLYLIITSHQRHVNLNYTVRIGVHYYFDLLISSTKKESNEITTINMTTTDYYLPFCESNFSLREKIQLYIRIF